MRYSLVLVICILVALLVLPYGSKYFLKRWLLNNGADSATIGEMKLDIFTGRVSLADVSIKRNDNLVLSNSTIYINLGLQALFDREALLQKATVSDTIIEVERTEDYLRIGSYPMNLKQDKAVEEEGLPWIFRAREVEFTDVAINYTQPGFNATLHIEQATVALINTDPQGMAGSLSFKGSINETPLQLNLDVLKIQPGLHLEGTIETAGFPVSELAGLFSLEQLQSSFATNASFVVLNGEAGLTASLEGAIKFSDIVLAGESWKATGALGLDGKLGYSSQAEQDSSVIVEGLLTAEPLVYTMPQQGLNLQSPLVTIDGSTTIGIAESVTVDSNGRLAVADTELLLDENSVHMSPGSWNGSVVFESATESEPMALQTDGSFDLSGIKISWPGIFELEQQRLTSQGIANFKIAEATRADYEGSINLSGTALTSEAASLQGEQIDIKGTAALTIADSIAASFDGSLDMTGASGGSPQSNFQGEQVSLTGSAAVAMDETTEISYEGSLAMTGASAGSEQFDYQGEQLSLEGNAAVALAETTEASYQGSLEATGTSINSGTLAVTGRQISVQGDTAVILGTELQANYQGDIRLAGIDAGSETFSLNGSQLSWQGGVSYNAGSEQSAQTLQLDGTLQTLDTALGLKEQEMQAAVAALRFTGKKAQVKFGDPLGYTGTSSLTAERLRLTEAQAPLLEVAALTVGPFSGDEDERLTLDEVTAQAISLPESALMPVGITIETARLQNAAGSLQSLDVESLVLAAPVITMNEQPGTLARFDSITLEQGTIKDYMQISVQDVAIDNGAFLSGLTDAADEPLITLGSATASPLSWSAEQGVRIELVSLENLNADYTRTAQQQKTDEQAPAEEQAEQDGAETGGIPLQISLISVSGSSELRFTDTTIDPAYETAVAIENLTVKNIDLNRPQDAFPYELRAMVEQYAPLTITGSVAPLASPFTLQQKGVLLNYSLQSLSPYVTEAVGISLTSGQLNLDSELAVEGQTIDSQNKLEIKNIVINQSDPQEMQQFESQLPVPLDLAIDMLSDKEGKITLAIPVSGTFADLDVGIEDIVITALKKSISRGIAPALAFTALGPGGALAYLGMKIGKSLLDTEMPVITFEQSQAELTQEQMASLNQVGEKLQEKLKEEQKTYSICPKVVPGETGADSETALSNAEERQELYQLGEQRAQNVKMYLLQRFDLKAEQLFICNPTLNYGESAKGTVQFSQ